MVNGCNNVNNEELMVHIEVTKKAQDELAGIMAKHEGKSIRLYIQGAG
jgi:Fe-S cluster assembly iron-binding protein IscA